MKKLKISGKFVSQKKSEPRKRLPKRNVYLPENLRITAWDSFDILASKIDHAYPG